MDREYLIELIENTTMDSTEVVNYLGITKQRLSGMNKQGELVAVKREFMRSLAKNAGYTIDYSKMDTKALFNAFVISFTKDHCEFTNFLLQLNILS